MYIIYNLRGNKIVNIKESVILAAGLGVRLMRDVNDVHKPLVEVGGLPLIVYSIASLIDLGIDSFYIIVNETNGDAVSRLFSDLDISAEIIVNKHPEKGNGYSLLLGMEHIRGRHFFLGMSDHLYQYGAHGEVLKFNADDILVAADPDPRLIDTNEATRLYAHKNKVLDIGKGLERFTHVDMGLFIINSDLHSLFTEVVHRSKVMEVSNLIRSAINKGYDVRAAEVRNYNWIDIDTIDDIRRIESSPDLLLVSLHNNLQGILSEFREVLYKKVYR